MPLYTYTCQECGATATAPPVPAMGGGCGPVGCGPTC